jgi:hypothetical protein
MKRILSTRVFAVLLAGLLCGAFATTAMATEPTAPDQVRPLLIGSALPDVEITNLDGESAPLADVVLGSPTLLVFYRGGW